jgi:uncharacterized protein YbaP (TraB family)
VPEALQVKQLGQTLDQMDQFKPLLAAMVGHWNKGDAEGLGALLNQSAEQMPEFYKMLLTDRNATWAEWIDKRMDQPGTVFVAVGAGASGGPRFRAVNAQGQGHGSEAGRVIRLDCNVVAPSWV